MSEEKVNEYATFREQLECDMQVDYLWDNRWKSGTVKQIRTDENENHHIIDISPLNYNNRQYGHRRNASDFDSLDTDEFIYNAQTAGKCFLVFFFLYFAFSFRFSHFRFFAVGFFILHNC